MKIKISKDELMKALAFLDKKCKPTHLELEEDINGRLLMKASLFDGNSITVIIYNSDTNKMSEATETYRI